MAKRGVGIGDAGAEVAMHLDAAYVQTADGCPAAVCCFVSLASTVWRVRWSREQVELLCALCRIRQQQGVRSLAIQCNVPVWVWIYWGEAYGVGVGQVQRAMQTWAQRRFPGRMKEIKHAARHLVELVNNDTEGGRRLAQREVEAWFSSGAHDMDELTDRLWRVYQITMALHIFSLAVPPVAKYADVFPSVEPAASGEVSLVDGPAGVSVKSRSKEKHQRVRRRTFGGEEHSGGESG
ncbi:hypothetical protein [Dictyobacter alpinus]|uniref:hypothetical protein n=1 Tax=Dictyobacter alpinus TaxID=2014873 RepID=UPI000F823897|nr:hypothetical protein [Dictyobacter alpinus]